jgi:hypothetical protein
MVMSKNAQQIHIEKKDEYLQVTLPGYESLRETESQISAVYDAVDHHNAPRLLIDSRATHRQIPIMELYELCLYVVAKFGPLRAKIGVVASPEAVYPDRFAENVMRNRGLDCIRFVDDEQEALDWLLASQRATVSES